MKVYFASDRAGKGRFQSSFGEYSRNNASSNSKEPMLTEMRYALIFLMIVMCSSCGRTSSPNAIEFEFPKELINHEPFVLNVPIESLSVAQETKEEGFPGQEPVYSEYLGRSDSLFFMYVIYAQQNGVHQSVQLDNPRPVSKSRVDSLIAILIKYYGKPLEKSGVFIEGAYQPMLTFTRGYGQLVWEPQESVFVVFFVIPLPGRSDFRIYLKAVVGTH